MMKVIGFICCFLFPFWALSQTEGEEVFKRIKTEMENYKVDTTDVPSDKLTKEIQKLRAVKGGFNINEAILFKIEEDRLKGNISQEESEKLESFFSKGKGKNWLDNAVIHIYRNYFSVSEVKKMCKFYQSSAGQKYSEKFPIILAQTTQAAELITDGLKNKKQK